MGLGHVFRSLTLARECRRAGARAVFLVGGDAEGIERRIGAAGVAVKRVSRSYPASGDLRALRAELKRRPGSWVVLDGYRFDAGLHGALRRAGARLAVFDDMEHLPRYDADVILNQNAGAQTLAYAAAAGALKLAGPRYTLIREEFARARRRERAAAGKLRRVLLAFGGSDPLNLSGKVLRALRRVRVPGLRVEVLLGGANAHESSVREEAARAPFPVEISVDEPDVASRMARADILVAAGGITSREAAYLGIPAVIGWFVENQRLSVEGLAAAGAAVSLGDWRKAGEGKIASALSRLIKDAPRRRALRAAGRRLVDGDGARRVVRILREVAREGGRPLCREAASGDLFDVWRLANEPSVRAHSFAKGRIPLQEHRRWYGKILASKRQKLYVIDAAGAVAGTVRYSLQRRGLAETHFSLHPAFRGRGWAALSLAATWPLARRALKARGAFGAVILPNAASEKVFARAGYVRAGERRLKGSRCAIYALPSGSVPR